MTKRKEFKKSTHFMEDESLFEWTNIVQELTGLPCHIWITSKNDDQEPVIMVQGDHSIKLRKDFLFTFSIVHDLIPDGSIDSLSSSDITLIKQFIQLNRSVLLDFWNETDINVESIISRFQKVG